MASGGREIGGWQRLVAAGQPFKNEFRSRAAEAVADRTLTPGVKGEMQVAERKLLLIGPDDQCRTLARTLRLLCRVDTRALGATATQPVGRPNAIVTSGIRLRDKPSIDAAQDALRPFLSKSIPILCLLDEPSAREAVQARMMGASLVLSSQAPTAVIASHVREMLRVPPHQRRIGDQAEARERVQDVGFVLADLMNAASTGMRVDDGIAAGAAALLTQALRNDGIGSWLRTVALIHDPTYRHCLLMAGIMSAFVLQLGFNGSDCDRMTRAAILHDIGKALVPLEIINKTDRLSEEEMAVVRSHATGGHELLVAQGGHHPAILDVVRHHHEYLDGSGYPDRLRGDQITDAVRIATICDVFAALIEKRAYKPSLPAREAFTLMEQMGAKLDQDLLRAFKRVFVPTPAAG